MAEMQRNEKKVMDRLLKFAVFGSFAIVTIYAVYYYSNAYKQSRTNVLSTWENKSVDVVHDLDHLKVGSTNLVYSPAILCAANNTYNDWSLEGKVECLGKSAINEQTTVAKAGALQEGFKERYTADIQKRFQNIPPLEINEDQKGISIRSIQFEHFAFPYHAMMNWQGTDSSYYRRYFEFVLDSMADIELAKDGRGFRYAPEGYERKLWIQQLDKGKPLKAVLEKGFRAADDSEIELVKMPVLDFDLLHKEESFTNLVYSKDTLSAKVVDFLAEVKVLVAPSLKQGNAYSIEDFAADKSLRVEPPFLVSMKNNGSNYPYFLAIVVDDELLLK